MNFFKPGRVRIPFYSTVAGTQISYLSPGHWWKNIREPVLFSSAVHNMISDGYKTFVEINAVPQFPRYMQVIKILCSLTVKEFLDGAVNMYFL